MANKKIGHVAKKRRGCTMRDVSSWKWVRAMAAHFKQEGKLFVPSCTELIKTSHGRDRAPQNPDWYYIRCAAVLRRIYMRPGTGTGGLSKPFGNKKNRGSQPEITTRAARGLLHWCCKSLEGLKLIQKGKTSGRCVSKLGRQKADTIASNLFYRRKAAATGTRDAKKKKAAKKVTK